MEIIISLQISSFTQWRTVARQLLSHTIAPHQVQWVDESRNQALFLDPCCKAEATASTLLDLPSNEVSLWEKAAVARTINVPRKLIDMLHAASCYRSKNRWSFLYKVLWRWEIGEHEVLSAVDEDGSQLHAMIKAVRREEHDMHAYVRFRERHDDAGPRFVAWYEPAHDVLPQVAQHFADRMGNVSWMIGTPDATVVWDGKQLHTAEALSRGPADIDDSGESLWLTYYRSIFNPSRLNTRVMQSHISLRQWKHLPEGRVVPAMVAGAATGERRTGQATAVGKRNGRTIRISAEQAQPARDEPATLDQCRRCELWERATQAVGGVGPQNARIMLVGEQPGDQEDLVGTPFIGPAGQLLDQLLRQTGLEREQVYLTNAVKHFKWEPRGKRRLHKTPGQREINACRYWLEEEMALVKPDVIVALGSTALKSILGTSQARLGDVLGKPFRHDGRWIITIYHPAYVLRVPDEAARQRALATMADGFKQALALVNAQDGPSAD